MEYRCYPRLSVGLLTEVYYRGLCLGTFGTRDISLEGMFVNTGPIGLNKNHVLTLRMSLYGDTLSMHGLVIHAQPDGVGLLLLNQTNSLYLIAIDSIRNNMAGPSQPTRTTDQDRPRTTLIRQTGPSRI